MSESMRPTFPLMGQKEVQRVYHLQMPRWLFSDPRYCDMNLEAKMVYVFLLNRFQLSRRNGWVNNHGEVYVVFPRQELANELRICQRRISAAFKTLGQLQLIWEKRTGRGAANRIFLAQVSPQERETYTSAPFVDPPKTEPRTADMEGLTEEYGQEPPIIPDQNPQIDDSRTAPYATLETPNWHPSNINSSYIDSSQKDISQSIPLRNEQDRLMDILAECHLDTFEPRTAKVFRDVITRLYYSEKLQVGDMQFPQELVRQKLALLHDGILAQVDEKLAQNTEVYIRNPTAYIQSMVFNAISEYESDFLLDPQVHNILQKKWRNCP